MRSRMMFRGRLAIGLALTFTLGLGFGAAARAQTLPAYMAS